uniref:Uncharacterized protein n=1 Tax=Serinus canaria TaxID=9135 RepID=A0A8C9NM06_SERCA
PEPQNPSRSLQQLLCIKAAMLGGQSHQWCPPGHCPQLSLSGGGRCSETRDGRMGLPWDLHPTPWGGTPTASLQGENTQGWGQKCLVGLRSTKAPQVCEGGSAQGDCCTWGRDLGKSGLGCAGEGTAVLLAHLVACEGGPWWH